jgi:hypothetical protein
LTQWSPRTKHARRGRQGALPCRWRKSGASAKTAELPLELEALELATYLLTWNPDVKDLPDQPSASDIGGWACHATGVKKGDRVFLMRQGREPRGVCASGVATGRTFIGKHFNPDRAREDKRYVPVRWHHVPRRYPRLLIPRSELLLGALGSMRWDIPVSGVVVPEPVARLLEARWRRIERDGSPLPGEATEASVLEGLRKEMVYLGRTRNRSLRNRALNASGGVCSVCDTDFSAVLDGRGERVLQVHHRRQLALSHQPRLTTLADLAVVCANCHALLHLDVKRALSIARLRRMLAQDNGGAL